MFLANRWWEEYVWLSSDVQLNYFAINQLKRDRRSDLEEFKGCPLEWKNVHCMTCCNYVDGKVICSMFYEAILYTILIILLLWCFYT